MNLERANWTLNAGRDWHVAWFQECLRIIDYFTEQDGEGHSWKWYSGNAVTFKTGTNLCHYVRCSVLWGPGIILLQLLMVSLVMGALFFLPLEAWGLGGYLLSWGILGLVALGLFGLWKFIGWADDAPPSWRFNAWLRRVLSEPVKNIAKRNAERLSFRNTDGVSFWSIVWAFVVTLKHQVCPLIKIEERE